MQYLKDLLLFMEQRLIILNKESELYTEDLDIMENYIRQTEIIKIIIHIKSLLIVTL